MEIPANPYRDLHENEGSCAVRTHACFLTEKRQPQGMHARSPAEDCKQASLRAIRRAACEYTSPGCVPKQWLISLWLLPDTCALHGYMHALARIFPRRKYYPISCKSGVITAVAPVPFQPFTVQPSLSSLSNKYTLPIKRVGEGRRCNKASGKNPSAGGT